MKNTEKTFEVRGYLFTMNEDDDILSGEYRVKKWPTHNEWHLWLIEKDMIYYKDKFEKKWNLSTGSSVFAEALKKAILMWKEVKLEERLKKLDKVDFILHKMGYKS